MSLAAYQISARSAQPLPKFSNANVCYTHSHYTCHVLQGGHSGGSALVTFVVEGVRLPGKEDRMSFGLRVAEI